MTRTRRIVFSTLAAALLAPGLTNAEPATQANEGEVSRAMFTTEVVEREPATEVRALEEGAPSVAYFTELKDMDGQTVIHRWEYEGEVMGEVAFDVEGERWRVHSTKQLDPTWTGQWVVKVMDVDGNVLTEDMIQYGSAGAKQVEPDVAPPASPAE